MMDSPATRGVVSVPALVLALAGGIASMDLAALSLFTDFRTHPTVLRTKLGVAASEGLTAALLSASSLLPRYCFCGTRSGRSRRGSSPWR